MPEARPMLVILLAGILTATLGAYARSDFGFGLGLGAAIAGFWWMVWLPRPSRKEAGVDR